MRAVYLAVGLLAVMALLGPLVGPARAEQPDMKIYVYRSSGCYHCIVIWDVLVGIYGEGALVCYDVWTGDNSYYYNTLYSHIFPGKSTDLPLVGVFRDNSLVAVVGGYTDQYIVESFWRGLESNTTPTAYYGGESFPIDNVSGMKSLFLQMVEAEEPQAGEILFPLILAALADSVNPCEFAVFVVLLTLISLRLRNRILRSGLSFIAAVFMTYFLMGLGLRQVFGTYGWLRYPIAAFGMFIGILQVSNFLAKQDRSPIPGSFQRRVRIQLEKVASPKGAFVTGVFVSLFLLPCTSGPYFIAISLISTQPYLGIPLLLLYNAIFVLPFFVILYGVNKLVIRTSGMKRWQARWGGLLDLISGIVLILLTVFLIFH